MDQDHDDAEQDVQLFLEDMASAMKYADDLTTLFKVLSVSNKRSKAAERAKATAVERQNATTAFRWQRKVQHLELQLEQAVMKLQAERNANDDVNRKHAQLQAMLG